MLADCLTTIRKIAQAKFNFIEFNEMQGMDTMKKLSLVGYFALTTLSTVGYGDYFPVSNEERILVILIMLSGVAFFSYIMGQFIEILQNFDKKMGIVDKSGDLHNWLIILTRFMNNQPLPKTLVSQIEENYGYHGVHDRLQCMSRDNMDDDYMNDLP